MNGTHDIQALRSATPAWFRRAMAVPRREGFVEVEGCSIHYLAWGDRNAPGLLFTHGRLSHARCWAFVAPLLAHRFHCVAFDLSGMGDSGTRATYRYAHRVKETFAVAADAGLFGSGRRPHLVSHSYGGVVAMRAIQHDPQHWASWVACELSLHHPDDKRAAQPRVDDKRGVRPPRFTRELGAAMERFRLAPEQPCDNPYLVEYMARHSLRETAEGWRWKFDPAVYSVEEEGHNDWWIGLADQLVTVPIPKAIVYAEHSTFVDPRSIDYLRNASPNHVAVTRIADAHHHLMLDQPLALAAAVEAHVDHAQAQARC